MRKKEKGIYEKAEKSPLEDVPSLKPGFSKT